MGNTFTAMIRDFIITCTRNGAFFFNLLRTALVLPLSLRSIPTFFRMTEESNINAWEHSAELIGRVDIKWFEDATKCVLYICGYNPIMDRVVTLAAFQAKRFPALTELFLYCTAPDTDEMIGMRFRTGIDIHELRNMFMRGM